MKKLLITFALITTSLYLSAQAYEIESAYYNNSLHKSIVGAVLIDNNNMAIVVDTTTFNVSFDIKTASLNSRQIICESVCNNRPAKLIINLGELNSIIVIFSTEEKLVFNIKSKQ